MILLCLSLLCIGLSIAVNSVPKREDWALRNVEGDLPDLRFSLIADNGKPVTAASFSGDIVLLYFGFTGCATACPLAMNRLGDALRRLDAPARPVRVVFVTVDPANDTPAALHRYLGAFAPLPATGLTGREADLRDLAKRYRAAYGDPRVPAQAPHGDAIYIFDAAGHARLLATPQDSAEAIAHDLSRLAAGR